MTTSQKAALSLLISVVLFGAFTVLSFTGLFDLIETRFYNPAITASMTRDITRNANEIEKFLIETQNRFAETLKVPAIRRSFLPNQGAEDIFERSRIYGLMMESLRGFQWVRFIDSGGARLHFSSYPSDIMQQDRLSVAYRNFDEPGFAYERIASENEGEPRYIFDERGDRIFFSFPFYDSFDVYRGTALFSLSVQAVADRLISEGRIRVGQDLTVISEPMGVFSGMASVGERVLPVQVSTIWKEGWQKTARLVSPSSGLSLALITVKTQQGFFIGRLVNEEMFLFPLPMKVILLVSFFLTIYLTIFLLFNLRQDSVTIVQNRLKQLQISLIEQFYERKGDVDWARWSRELEQRRDEISLQLKQGVKTSSGQNKDLDVLIDKSWNELLSVMGGRKDTGIDEEKLQIILNRLLAALPASGAALKVSPQISAGQPVSPGTVKQADEADEAEEIEELAEELSEEPSGELPPADHPAEEAVADLEDLEEAEELAEEAGTTEDAELVEEAEAIEEVEAIEEAGDIEEVKSVSIDAPDALVPVIDVIDMNLSVAAADEVVNDISGGKDIEELEELSDIDELEDVESAEDEGSEKAAPAAQAAKFPASPHTEPLVYMNLGRHPEIGPETETEDFIEIPLGDDFEIVSPFSDMVFDFSESDDNLIFLEEEPMEGNDQNTPASVVEEVSGGMRYLSEAHIDEIKGARNKNFSSNASGKSKVNALGFYLMSKPFQDRAGGEKVEVLESLDKENDDDIPMIEVVDDDELVIEEREGVPYISDVALGPGDKSNPGINMDFKDLVDSVIK